MKVDIDHVTLCFSSLDESRNRLAAAGLRTDYGGPHANGATHMALFGFDDGSYLELIAPMKSQATIHGAMAGWSKLTLADAGPCAWAVRTARIDEEVERLKAAGVVVTSPEAGGRKKIDGTILRWQTAAVGPGASGALLPFMIQDETSREQRVRPSEGARDTGLTGVETVVLGVRDLDAAVSLFRTAYGWDVPVIENHGEFGANLAYFVNAPVMLATPSNHGSWLTSRLSQFGNCPVAFLLRTRDLSRATERFGLLRGDKWFHRDLAWFDEKKLGGARVGVIQ